MTVRELAEKNLFTLVNEGDDMDVEISRVFCCDLLSIAMGRAPSEGAWVTVMGNMNTLAVASLTETACIILAEGAVLDETAAGKAKIQGINVFKTEKPIFEAALKIHREMEKET